MIEKNRAYLLNRLGCCASIVAYNQRYSTNDEGEQSIGLESFCLDRLHGHQTP